MAPQETQKLDEIRDSLGEFRGDFRVFVTKILGDDESENSKGRLPRVERDLAGLNKRVGRIEKLIAMAAGAVVLIKCAAWCADSFNHVLEVINR
jgi:hypothetical protein